MLQLQLFFFQEKKEKARKKINWFKMKTWLKGGLIGTAVWIIFIGLSFILAYIPILLLPLKDFILLLLLRSK